MLLVWDAPLVLYLCLYVVDGVGRLDLEGDGLAGRRPDEDLYTTPQTKDEMERRILLHIVIGEGAGVLELLAGKDKLGNQRSIEGQREGNKNLYRDLEACYISVEEREHVRYAPARSGSTPPSNLRALHSTG